MPAIIPLERAYRISKPIHYSVLSRFSTATDNWHSLPDLR